MNKRVRILITIGVLLVLAVAFYIVSYLITKHTGYSVIGITGRIVGNKEVFLNETLPVIVGIIAITLAMSFMIKNYKKEHKRKNES